MDEQQDQPLPDRAARSPAPHIGVGMLGYAFMGKAHVNAYRTIGSLIWPRPLQPDLVLLAGRSGTAVAEAAARYGFASHTTDWSRLVESDDVDLVDICGPNAVHSEVALAAARRGKHLLCEKPLGRDAAESLEMWRSAKQAGVRHMCAFNYRFVPAVRLAWDMITGGEIGEPRQFSGRYLQEWLIDPRAPRTWRLERRQAGSGALGDIGSHLIDLARYLVGEIAAVSGTTRTFTKDRPGGAVDVDDGFAATVEFEHGAIGTLMASRVAPGRKNALQWEINGSRGSLCFDLERMNELRVARADVRGRVEGFTTVLVSERDHPFWEHWWPPGHLLGWEHTFVHEIRHLLQAIAAGTEVSPHGATFEDGYRAAEVCDAILAGARSGVRVPVRYEAG
jgi:predicted dehydrogenase